MGTANKRRNDPRAWIVNYLGLQVKTPLITSSSGWATAIVRENANEPTRKPQSHMVDHN